MRFLVLLLGLAGSAAAGYVGYQFLTEDRFRTWYYDQAVSDFAAFYNVVPFDPGKTAYFLLIGAGLGVLGSLLAVMRCGPQGGVLMLLSMVGPAILFPATVPATGLLGLTGLLSFGIRSRPAPRPA